MPRTIRIDHLCTVPELADTLERPVRNLYRWSNRKDFPRPVKIAGGVKLYDRVEVSAWCTDHDKGHGRHMAAIREYRRTGRVRAAARFVDVSPETFRRWCRKHGEPLPRDPWPEDVPKP